MKAILTRFFNHEELTTEEARQLLLNISRGMCPEAQTVVLLTAFQMHGITVDKLVSFREALMETRIHIDLAPYRPISIVSTGGDRKNTFSISTCAYFIVAGTGYRVAEHGNYDTTSVSGASNVIEQHGVRFTNNPDTLKRDMEECNITYPHAQLFNPAMKLVAPVCKALGVHTLFNLLEPLMNPCEPAYQSLGVIDLSQVRLYTNVFYKLGINFAVVNNLDNHDEISLADEFKVMTRSYERIYRPQALGFSAVCPEGLSGDICKEDAAHIFNNVLNNRAEAAQTQCATISATFAIQVVEPEKEIEECIAIAHELLESGRALETLEKFIEVNH